MQIKWAFWQRKCKTRVYVTELNRKIHTYATNCGQYAASKINKIVKCPAVFSSSNLQQVKLTNMCLIWPSCHNAEKFISEYVLGLICSRRDAYCCLLPISKTYSTLKPNHTRCSVTVLLIHVHRFHDLLECIFLQRRY
jgi:hypothetical protein